MTYPAKYPIILINPVLVVSIYINEGKRNKDIMEKYSRSTPRTTNKNVRIELCFGNLQSEDT